MRTRPGAIEVLKLGLLSVFCSALLLSPAWAGQTFHNFNEDGIPLRAKAAAPKAPAVQQPNLNLPAKPSSQAKVPAVMMDNITKKSAHQQAEGDPDRPLTLGKVPNQESQGQGKPAAMQGYSMGKLKVQGDMDPQGRQALGDFLGTANPLPLPQGSLQGEGGPTQPHYERKNMSIIMHDNSDPGVGGEPSSKGGGSVQPHVEKSEFKQAELGGLQGEAADIPPSKGPLKLKGTLSDGTYKPGEGVSFDGKINDKSEPGGAAKGEVVVIGSKVKEAIKAEGTRPPADVQDMKGDITRMK